MAANKLGLDFETVTRDTLLFKSVESCALTEMCDAAKTVSFREGETVADASSSGIFLLVRGSTLPHIPVGQVFEENAMMCAHRTGEKFSYPISLKTTSASTFIVFPPIKGKEKDD